MKIENGRNVNNFTKDDFSELELEIIDILIKPIYAQYEESTQNISFIDYVREIFDIENVVIDEFWCDVDIILKRPTILDGPDNIGRYLKYMDKESTKRFLIPARIPMLIRFDTIAKEIWISVEYDKEEDITFHCTFSELFKWNNTANIKFYPFLSIQVRDKINRYKVKLGNDLVYRRDLK